MAVILRRCIMNMKSAVKLNYRKYHFLSQTGCLAVFQSIPVHEYKIKTHFNENIKWHQFHTTSINNKIVSFKLSDIGEGIREVNIKEWFVKEGDKVQQFDNICEVQSDKAVVTITSRYDGIIKRLHYQLDQTALVGQPLVDIEVDNGNEEDSESSEPEIKNSASGQDDKPTTQKIKVLTTPSVRRIASQFKVDLSTIKATGRNGRILKEDLLSHLNMSAEKSNEIPEVTTHKARSPPSTEHVQMKTEVSLEDRIVPVSGFTKAMVKSMSESLKIPHFGYCDEYNVTKLVEARQQLKGLAKEHGVRLTYMPVIIKALSLCLTTNPILNSSLDSSLENVIYKASHNIGVAMDTNNGLVVPVIHNVQSKSILDVAKELNILQDKGLKGQLSLKDITGGTITLSNIGIIGGTYTKPVILAPQVAIGAFGKIQVLPRFDSCGNIEKAHILTVSWSADHRIIDGVTMANFSNQLKQYLENPNTMLLEL